MDRGDCQQELCRRGPGLTITKESLVFAGLDGGVGVGGVKRSI